MKIDNKVEELKAVKVRTIASYSPEDICNLISKDLARQGYKADSVNFFIDWKWESDEQGNNSHIVTKLIEAYATIEVNEYGTD